MNDKPEWESEQDREDFLRPTNTEIELARKARLARKQNRKDFKEGMEGCLSMIILLLSSGMLMLYGFFTLF